jgi:hypothetical protein
MLLNDNVLPTFIQEPQLVDDYGNIFSKGLGSQATIKIDVEDNTGIEEISLFKSKDTTPFLKLIEKSNRKKVNDVFSFNLPPSEGIYSIFVRVIDTNGNTVIREVKVQNKNTVAKFNSLDNIAPTLIQNIFFEKDTTENNNDYIKFRLEDQGFGFQSVKVLIANQTIDLNISDEIGPNRFVIENKNYWKESGVAYVSANFPPGIYDVTIIAKDKKNNEFLDTQKLEIESNKDYSDTLEVNLDYKKNVLPNEVYTLTVEATSLNYVKQILVDGKEIYPKDGLTKINVTVRENKKAPSTVSKLPISHKIEVSSFLTNSTKSYTANVYVKNDEIPEYEYFDIYKIDGSNLIPIKDADVYQNDKLLVKFKVMDDISLDKVNLYYGQNGIKEYSVFKKDNSSNNYNEYYEGEETIIVDSNNFEISLEIIDKSGNKLNWEKNGDLKKIVVLKDESAPIIEKVNIIDGNRKITGSKTFKVAKNNDILFNVKIQRKPSKISSVKIHIKDSSGGISSTIYTEVTNNVFEFNTVNPYPVPDKDSVFFDVEVIDSEGNKTYKENYELMIFDNEEDIYVPKIRTNDFSKIIIPEGQIGPFEGYFSDDGLLKSVQIQVFKKNEDGSLAEILKEDGTIDENSLVKDGSEENPLGLKNASLSLNKWVPRKDGEYVIVFYAKNTENYNSKTEVNVEVKDISVTLINPPDQNAYLYGGSIDVEIQTIQNSDNNIFIYYDSNDNGVFEDDEITYEKNYNIDIPPDGVIKDNLITANYSIFPNVGNYKIQVKRSYAGFTTSDEVFVTLEDLEDFSFSRNGLKFKSDVGINESVDSGEYVEENGIYYIPINFDGENQSNIDVEIKVLGYSLINSVNLKVNGNNYSMALVSTYTPDNYSKREFTFETTIESKDIQIEDNSLIFLIENYFNETFYNSTEKALNLRTIGLNKPRVNSFNMNIYDIDTNYILNNDNYQSPTQDIIFEKSSTYQLLLTNIYFEDDYKLWKVDYYWRNKSNNNEIPINSFRFQGNPTISTNPSDFGGAGFDFNAPDEQGTYELIMEVKNGNYEMLENAVLSDYMNEIKDYNSKKIIIDSQVLQFLNMIANIVHDPENINNKGLGVIPLDAYDINLIIQNIEFLNKKSFNVFIDQLDKTYNLSIINTSIPDKNDTEKNFVVQVDLPENIYDGEATLRVIFENTKGEQFETSDKVIIDRKSPYALPKPDYDFKENAISISLDQNILYNDISDVYFEVKGYGIVQKNNLEKIISNNQITYKYILNDFYINNNHYFIRAIVKDKNSNIFIGEYQEITIQNNNSVIDGLNNLSIYDNLIAVEKNSRLKIYDENGFEFIKIESSDGNIYNNSISEKEYLADISTITASEIAPNDLMVTIRDKIGNKTIYNFELYKYDYTKSINPFLNYDNTIVYSNKNTGIYPLDINFGTNIKLRAVSISSFYFKNISQELYMNKMSSENEFSVVLPKLKEGISSTITLEASIIDISGRVENDSIDINVDTKKPQISSLSSISPEATKINDTTYEISINDVDNLFVEWTVVDDHIDTTNGNVYVSVNNNLKEIKDNKLNVSYDFSNIEMYVDNEYEVYLYAVDSAGNFNTSNKIIIKVLE